MNRRAVIYARVSSEEQAEAGYGLQRQIPRAQEYAQEKGLIVKEVITDDISGAIKMEERPGGGQVISLIRAEKIDAIIVDEIGRLSRDYINLLVLIRDLNNSGIELHTCEDGHLKNDLDVLLIIGLKGWMAQKDWDFIARRTREGRLDKARDGKWVGVGVPPYGYRREGEGKNATLVICPHEADVVKDIFEWYVHGNGYGPMSLRAIGRKLDKHGIKPTTSKKNQAKYWSPNTIRRMLKNSIYTGEVCFGKDQIVSGKRIRRPKSEWIIHNQPELAIVDRATFEGVKPRLERNRQLAKRNRKRPYLLSGFVRCGNCGRAMVGWVSKSGKHSNRRYSCTSRFRKNSECPLNGPSIMAHRIEGVAWDWLVWLLSDDEVVKAGIRKMTEQSESNLEPIRRRLNTILDLLFEEETKIKRLVVEMANHDDYVLEIFRQQVREAQDRKDGLEIERKRLEAELTRSEITPTIMDDIIAITSKYRRKLPTATVDERRYIMDRLNFKAIFHKDENGKWLELSCGLGEDVIELPPS